jgi:uncharacterized membrane protein
MSNEMSPVYEIGVITFADAAAAERLVSSLRDRGAVGMTNEVGIVEHHASGRFSVHSYTAQHTRGRNVAEGALVGALAGALVLGPFGLIAGIFGGGLVGASFGGAPAHDLQLGDAFVSQLKAALPPGSSAVLIVGEPETVDQLVHEIHSAAAVTSAELREPLTDVQVAAVREALEGDEAS